MTRELYLQELRLRLSHRMTEQELGKLMRYYEEYFNEAGPDGEQRVMEELGAPEKLVRRILGERVVEELEVPAGEAPGRRAGPRDLWLVALAVCAAPVAIPMSIGLIALAFALVVAALVLVAGVGFGGLVLIAAGGISAVTGFTSVLTHGMATALYFMGGGALTAGVGLLLLAAAIGICALCCRCVIRLLSRGLRRGGAQG